MNPGTRVSTTALNLTRSWIPSLISRTASSGSAETSKFSLLLTRTSIDWKRDSAISTTLAAVAG
jgi:hypothetical protein